MVQCVQYTLSGALVDVEDGDERRFPETCDVQDLDHTMRILFSYTSSGFLRYLTSCAEQLCWRVKTVYALCLKFCV